MRRPFLRLAFGVGVVLTTLVGVACGLDITGREIVGVEAGLDSAFDRSAANDADDVDASGPPKDDSGADDGSPCNGRGGPRMVDVGGYCIDATEVTQAQYMAFISALRTGAFDAGALSVCSWKTSYEPSSVAAGVDCHWGPDASPNVAVVCVDWCDAEAFCRWSGKRLCGAIDGGAVAWDGNDTIDPNKDAWYRACSHAGTMKYPYGSTYIDKACNTAESAIGRAADAGSELACVGGYAGLFDMVGNVDEQEDACKGVGGASDPCHYRGGSWFWTGATENSCEHRYSAVEVTRGARFADVGFRCCSR